MLCPACLALAGCPICFTLYSGLDLSKRASGNSEAAVPEGADEPRAVEIADDG